MVYKVVLIRLRSWLTLIVLLKEDQQIIQWFNSKVQPNSIVTRTRKGKLIYEKKTILNLAPYFF